MAGTSHAGSTTNTYADTFGPTRYTKLSIDPSFNWRTYRDSIGILQAEPRPTASGPPLYAPRTEQGHHS